MILSCIIRRKSDMKQCRDETCRNVTSYLAHDTLGVGVLAGPRVPLHELGHAPVCPLPPPPPLHRRLPLLLLLAPHHLVPPLGPLEHERHCPDDGHAELVVVSREVKGQVMEPDLVRHGSVETITVTAVNVRCTLSSVRCAV